MVVGLVCQTDQLLIKDLAILVDTLIGVTVGIDTNEDGFKVEVFELLALSNSLKSFAHLHQRDRAHVGAEREPEIYEVILSLKVVMSERLTLCVI